MITATNLTKTYKGITVLNIEHLEIPAGESFGLVGNNGAGKTTFFSLLLDLVPPSTGNIFNNEFTVSESEDWKSFTSSFIDDSFLIGYLTPEEYFYFIGQVRQQNRTDVDILLAGFEEFFNGEITGKQKYLRDLSKGNQKKVGIVGTFIGNPKIIILDEPFANLDPTSQIRLKKILKDKVEKRDTTFLISSHDLIHITGVCERIVVLDKGVITRDIKTSPQTLRELENYFSGGVTQDDQAINDV